MEEVAEEMCKVAYLIGFLVEDVVVVGEEGAFEEFLELVVVGAEAFSQQSEEGLVDALHHAAFQDHIHQFMLVTLSDVHLQDLVCALLEVYCRLDSQVDRLTQVHQVLLSQILDPFLCRRSIVLLLIGIWLLQPRQVLLSQDFLLYSVPLRLSLLVVGVQPEDVKPLLATQFLF